MTVAKLLPEEDDPRAFVIRTDFSNEDAWNRISNEIREAMRLDEMPDCCFIEDRKYDQATVDDLLPAILENSFHSFVFVVDHDSIHSEELTVLVVDLVEEPGRTFRAIPGTMFSIHANLSLANMEFADYAEDTDPDGIFRGFADSH